MSKERAELKPFQRIALAGMITGTLRSPISLEFKNNQRAQPPTELSSAKTIQTTDFDFWNYEAMNLESAFAFVEAMNLNNPPVVVAVLDTGHGEHPELEFVPGYSVRGGDPHETSCGDYTGHATATDGVIAARGIEMTGICPYPLCVIMPIKIFYEEGDNCYAYPDEVADGVLWAVDHGAKVIVIQVAFGGGSQALFDAINYALAHDVVVVSARGNRGSDKLLQPACQPGVLTSVATDRENQRMDGSSYGGKDSDQNLTAAPGQACAPWKDGEYTCGYAGSSTSAAETAGLAALIRAINPEYTAEEVVQIIREASRDLGEPGYDNQTGWGLDNVLEAVLIILEERGDLTRTYLPSVMKEATLGTP